MTPSSCSCRARLSTHNTLTHAYLVIAQNSISDRHLEQRHIEQLRPLPRIPYISSINVQQPPCSSPCRPSFSLNFKCDQGPRQSSSFGSFVQDSCHPQDHHQACQGYQAPEERGRGHFPTRRGRRYGLKLLAVLVRHSDCISSYHALPSLTRPIVQCARSKSWSLTPPSSIVRRGTPSRFHRILHLTYRDPSCRRRDSVVPTTNPYLSLASSTKMLPSAHLDDVDFGSKIPTYVAAMRPTPRPTSNARIPPIAQ